MHKSVQVLGPGLGLEGKVLGLEPSVLVGITDIHLFTTRNDATNMAKASCLLKSDEIIHVHSTCATPSSGR